MARSSPNPSESPASFDSADKEESIEIGLETATVIDKDHVLAPSRLECASFQGYLAHGSACDQVPSEGVVKGGGDGNATFVPNLYIYDDADDEQPYVPISCLLTDCNGPITPVYFDSTCCQVEGSNDALPTDASHKQAPSTAYTKLAACMEYNSKVVGAALDLFGVPAEMRAGVAKSAETPVTVKGVDGFVFTYLPSQLEEAKRMSVDEVMVSLADLNEKIRKRRAFHRKMGRIILMAGFLQSGSVGKEAI